MPILDPDPMSPKPHKECDCPGCDKVILGNSGVVVEDTNTGYKARVCNTDQAKTVLTAMENGTFVPARYKDRGVDQQGGGGTGSTGN